MHGLNMLVALLGLLAIAMTAALPQVGVDTPTTGGVGTLVPTSVEVMYYQAPWQPTSTSCVSGPLTAARPHVHYATPTPLLPLAQQR